MMHRWAWRRAVATAAMATLVGAGIVAVTAAPANAGTVGNCYRFQFVSSNLRMTVEDNTEGGRIVQQWAQDGPRYTWCLDPDGFGDHAFLLRNASTGRCVTSDGVAGHALTQRGCSIQYANQLWLQWDYNYNGQTVWALTNVQYGVTIDVSGDSHSAGAIVDGWRQTSGQRIPLNEVMYEV